MAALKKAINIAAECWENLGRIVAYWTAWIFMIFFMVKVANLAFAGWKIPVQIGFVCAPFISAAAARTASAGMFETSKLLQGCLRPVQFFAGMPPFSLWWVYSVAIFKSFVLSGDGSLAEATDLAMVQGVHFLITRLRVCAVVNASGRRSDEWVPWHWRQLCRTNEVKDKTEDLIRDGISEVLAPLHFAVVLLFNCLGPNRGAFYQLEILESPAAIRVAGVMLTNSLCKAISLGLTVYELRSGLLNDDAEQGSQESRVLAAVQNKLNEPYGLHLMKRRYVLLDSCANERFDRAAVSEIVREAFPEETEQQTLERLVGFARRESPAKFLDRVLLLWIDREWLRLVLLFAANVVSC